MRVGCVKRYDKYTTTVVLTKHLFDFFIQMSEIFLRIKQLAEHYGVTKPSEFAKKTGFSHQTATNYLKGLRTPNTAAFEIIQQSFDGLNIDWLLTGRGEMLKADKGNANAVADDTQNTYKTMADVNAALDLARETIRNQERIINNHEYLIEKAEQLIKYLEEENKRLRREFPHRYPAGDE